MALDTQMYGQRDLAALSAFPIYLQDLYLPGVGQSRTALQGKGRVPANPGSRMWRAEQELQQQMVKPYL